MILVTREHEQESYWRLVDREVVLAVRSGARGFVEILRRLPSVYPMELIESIGRLTAQGAISIQLGEEIRSDAARSRAQMPEVRSLLPVPHPLDFEWRYAASTSRDLLNLASYLTPSDGEVLLFGTPGLAVEALSLPVTPRISFLSEDNVVTQRVRLLNRAVGSPLSIRCMGGGVLQESADVVVMDPPWYMDFIRPMLATAAGKCRRGGSVLITLPSRGTRPSAEADCAAVFQYAAAIGLDLLDLQPLAVDYDTPFFEANALAAAGVHAPARWRRGDLAVLRKVEGATLGGVPVSSRSRNWTEVCMGRMRLFIRTRIDAATGSQGLIRLIDGDVLPSVSRKDARRHGAMVWTSGNRIFGTDNPDLVLEAALSNTGFATRSGVQTLLWGNLYRGGELDRVGRELRGLADLEAAEEQGSLAFAPERRGPWTLNSTKSWDTFAVMTSG